MYVRGTFRKKTKTRATDEAKQKETECYSAQSKRLEDEKNVIGSLGTCLDNVGPFLDLCQDVSCSETGRASS